MAGRKHALESVLPDDAGLDHEVVATKKFEPVGREAGTKTTSEPIVCRGISRRKT